MYRQTTFACNSKLFRDYEMPDVVHFAQTSIACPSSICRNNVQRDVRKNSCQ